MVKLLFFRFRVTNSQLKNKKIHFELLTQWVDFYFLTFGYERKDDKSENFLKHYSLNVREL